MPEALRDADEDSFAELIEPHHRELHPHCFRMLGSVHDADDALQEALLGAWKGLSGFEGRSSDELLRYEDREGVELAYVAALQLLPPNQRAALLLRDALGFSARETAEILDTSVASVNSALQRARAKLERELPARSRQETLRALGDERSRGLVARFVDAWNRTDIATCLAAHFEAARSSGSTWRFDATSASGQAAMVGYRHDRESGLDRLDALVVITFEGELVAAVTTFLGPGVLARIAPPATPTRTDEFRP